MATVNIYLDTRRASQDTERPVKLKIAVQHRHSTGYISLNMSLLPSQWDKATNRVIGHPQRALLNARISKVFGDVNDIVLRLTHTENINALTTSELCHRIKSELGIEQKERIAAPKKKEDTRLVTIWFDKWMSHKDGRTKELYQATVNRIKAWLGEEEYGKLHFEDINRDWLLNFDDFMAQTAPSANSRAINMRNLRAVCNYAIDNDVTTHYPFRRFKIETETTRKRNLDIDTLRKLFNHRCEEEWQQRYLDAFKLSFMLIGINMVDLCKLTEVKNGRIEYIRSKTKKRYDIKAEVETLLLIDKYIGEGQLLNYLDTCKNYRHFYNRLCLGLTEIRKQLNIEELTSYYARHTWATIASKLDIPHDTIARALGHGGHTVTDIYIDFDMSKVDDANRKVLDYVLYNIDYRVPKQLPTPIPQPEKKRRGRPKKNAMPEDNVA